MGEPLRILIAEDSEDDLLLILRELRHGGYDPVFERVDTPAALRAALEIPTWDIILCDYVMPQLSMTEALKQCREKAPEVPFIVISGVFGEYMAARALAAGARDYLVKGDLPCLVPAIRKACEEAPQRRAEKAQGERGVLLRLKRAAGRR